MPNQTEPRMINGPNVEGMVHQKINRDIEQREEWALRRQLNVPNNRRLWVLACMDERLPVEEALGIRPGDAHIFRNAGGLVTDDAIRSAMLSTQFFGTNEIIVINHTECGMMSASGDGITQALKDKGVDIDRTPIDPALPELSLQRGAFAKWIKSFDDVDEICVKQVELLRGSPLIPDHVIIHGYVWEVERTQLRKPHARMAERVNRTKQTATAG